jgi:hypothetical protein
MTMDAGETIGIIGAHLDPPFRTGADARPTLNVMSKPPRVPILRQR